MKCLFCASEVYPFIASGGLADVAYSLPVALRKEGIDCRVVLPLYKNISKVFKNKMKFITNFQVPIAWRRQYCGVFKLDFNNVVFYFLDNEYYFNRDNLYGYYDDGERFAFFSRAILEMIPRIDFKPKIIHANDWQTALVPVFYNLIFKNFLHYENIKTIFEIHNVQYQGKFSKDVLEDIVGVKKENFNVLYYDDCVNFMKAGIESSNKVVTVSKTYAREILDPWYAHSLHYILRDNKKKLVGILNGIDENVYNPRTDTEIYENYSADTLCKKIKNKEELSKRLNLHFDETVPLIGMVTRLVEHKGIDLVVDALEKLLQEEKLNFVVLGSGEGKYEQFFDYMQAKYQGKVSSCHGFVPELSHKIYAASDMFLMPSKMEPCGLAQMIALKYGAIPIVRNTGGLSDTVKDSGDQKGNGFVFQNYNSSDMLWAIKRAIMGFNDKNGWQTLTKRAMKSDNSWKNSAKEYKTIYNELT